MKTPTGNTRVLTVIGHPVTHSLSPIMQNAAFTALGLDAVYVVSDVLPDHLSDAFTGFKALGIGGNITFPHKVESVSKMDKIHGYAPEVGAVNTFWLEEGVLNGTNTDVDGVLHAAELIDADGPWLVLGTGGSARAVVVAAKKLGIEIKVSSRNEARAAEFAAWARELGVRADADDGGHVQTIVNTTPLGLSPNDGLPVGDERTKAADVALDLVYRRGATPWIRKAQELGLRAMDGREVLIGQGKEALRTFFPHIDPPVEVMRGAVMEVLGTL